MKNITKCEEQGKSRMSTLTRAEVTFQYLVRDLVSRDMLKQKHQCTALHT
jgi:hypothetical protein